MSMDLRLLFKKQEEQNKGKNKKAPLVIEDDGDDFKAAVNLRTAVGKKGKTVGKTDEGIRGGGKRKRTRQRIMDSDSEGETPKKKTKATPTKKVGKSGKGGKSPAPAIKKQIKSAADFFGSAPVQRSSYFKTSSSATRGEKRRADQDTVRVSESPTEEMENSSSKTESETSSQFSSSTPVKKLRLLVNRIPTPPKLPQTKNSQDKPELKDFVTSEKSVAEQLKEGDECDEHMQSSLREEKDGVGRVRKREGAVRRSPRAHMKRGRQAEAEGDDVRLKESEREREKEGEGEGDSRNDSQKFSVEKEVLKVGERAKRKVLVAGEDESKSQKEIKPLRQQKARKAIKYLDDSEEESECAGGEGGRGKKEQAILTISGTSGKALGLASPHKKAASSPRGQTTPDRDEYLVKQPGLTFDKEKSASPIKPVKKSKDGSSAGVHAPSSPVVKLAQKSISSPAKLVSKPSTKPVTPVSKPASKSVKPVSTPSSTTPSGKSKPSRASSYRNYMNRSGPKAPGSKIVPDGEENCFEGLTFVITGVLESLEREEAADIVKRYGGKVTSNVSKKTSYLVVGEEAGESKLAKAAQCGTKKIDEDGLLELLRTRPGKKVGVRGGTPAGSKKPSSRKPRLPASPPSVQSRGLLKGGKVKSKSPPSGVVESDGGSIVTTPTRHHVTSVAMATPSPSTSSAAGTPLVATPKMEGAHSLLWVDKYRPKSLKHVIGQQGDKSNAKKLLRWLLDWEKNHSKSKGKGGGGGGGRKGGGGGWGSSGQGDGGGLRAALLSGPPGVGKTTTAVLACEEAGYSYVELNASATRSKRTLHDEVATHLDCTSLDVFRTEKVGVASGRRHALIMDEVDGMAGNEDRGGVQEVISMVKNTKIPIICICNDRQHPKIRSLANHCYDLRFHRPRVDQIRGAMMSVCYKEGVKMAPNALAEIIMASGQDVRQVLHNLSVWTATDKNLSYDQAKATAKSAKKESKLNPFDVVKLVFMPREGDRDLSLAERSDLFFHDYSLAPLFVQENYPSVRPLQAKGDVKHTLRLLADTADCLSTGDMVERKIRSSSQWSLLPVQAVFSSVLPGQLMRGHVGRPEFPRWLGNNSTRGKNDRLLQELQRHTRLKASCNKTEFGMDYLPFFHTRLTQPLLSEGTDGVSKVVAMMTTYDLVREDWDSIVDLNQFPGQPNKTSDIPSKVKSAFTRSYNKEHHKSHYAADALSKKSRVATTTEEEHDDSPDSEPESESDVLQDRMVKVKNATKEVESRVASSKKSGGGGGGDGGRGKGKGRAGASHPKKK